MVKKMFYWKVNTNKNFKKKVTKKYFILILSKKIKF